ncbi:hypothetical protein T4B_4080 [Trichinella pseudospiralis]|uniref:Uncharacterized protein n=1 Tax=Trichinella pseudospiralis TaxID=6337 RepID=A0A0V1GNZ8_TRIPS|nr:hypothetical protein T4B_4080 [Trichinella pseudospiralis]
MASKFGVLPTFIHWEVAHRFSLIPKNDEILLCIRSRKCSRPGSRLSTGKYTIPYSGTLKIRFEVVAMMDPMKRIGRLFNAYILCCLGGGCMMSVPIGGYSKDEIRCFQENVVSTGDVKAIAAIRKLFTTLIEIYLTERISDANSVLIFTYMLKNANDMFQRNLNDLFIVLLITKQYIMQDIDNRSATLDENRIFIF